jgi:uroporphyrinogen-III synthase
VTERASLDGLRAVVTSPQEGARGLADGLAEAGANVAVAPLIEIEDPDSWAPLDSALEELASGIYDWLVVPSANSARRVVARLDVWGRRTIADTRVATVGPSTALVLKRGGIDVDLIASPHTSEALVGALGDGSSRILLPRVAEAPRDFVDLLGARGWDVHEVPAYRNVPVGPHSPGVDRITSGDFDLVTLTSASAARNLAALAPPSSIGLQPDAAPGKTVACIGPSTADAARAAGLRVDVVAAHHSAPGLVQAIIAHFQGMGR